MNTISIKWLKRLKWIASISFSMIISFLLIFQFKIDVFNWEYWVITLPINAGFSIMIGHILEHFYQKRKNSKLNFKQYVSDEKSGGI